MKLTITEALAEIKTIAKRIQKNREFVEAFLYRQESRKDPHEKDGGSFQAVKSKRQAISDLENRLVSLRASINHANEITIVTICGESKTIADWIIWRREVSPAHKEMLNSLSQSLISMRDEARKKGMNVVNGAAENDMDIIVNINEKELYDEIEKTEEILGSLDGKLSLINATTFI